MKANFLMLHCTSPMAVSLAVNIEGNDVLSCGHKKTAQFERSPFKIGLFVADILVVGVHVTVIELTV